MEAREQQPSISLPGPGKAYINFARELGSALAKVNAQGERRYCIRYGLFGEIRETRTSGGFYLSFSPITPATAVTDFEEHVIFTGNHGVVRSMSVQLAKIILSSRQFKSELPKVDRLLLFPVPAGFRTDPAGRPVGIVMVEKGFSSHVDATGREIRYYCHTEQLHYVAANAQQSLRDRLRHDIRVRRECLDRARDSSEREDIREVYRKKHEKRKKFFENNSDALAILLDLFADFDFEDDFSQGLAVARLITPYCRGLMGWGTRSPCWFISAEGPRSGKDYLAKMAPMLFEGIASEDAPLDASEDEVKRRITASVIAGLSFIHFGNCRGPLDSPSLESAITSEVWTDRVIGTSETVRMPIESIFSLSYNSSDLGAVSLDLRLRSRNIHLVDALDGPDDRNKRDFRGRNLMRELTVDYTRTRIVAAIAALLRKWIAEGCPDGPIFSSFPEWGKIVGGVIMSNFSVDVTKTENRDTLPTPPVTSAFEKEFEELIGLIADDARRRTVDFQGILDIAKADAKRFPILGTTSDSRVKQPLGRLLTRKSKNIGVPGGVKVKLANLDARRKQWKISRLPEIIPPESLVLDF